MDDCVSAFIIGTCRMIPKSTSDVSPYIYLQRYNVSKGHTITCGSTAEFYIQPLYSCIGDIDSVVVRSHYLAFTPEIPVLPNDFRFITDTFDCFLIEPYHDYPAFIRLQRFGKMRYNWTRKSFEFTLVSIRELLQLSDVFAIDKCENMEYFLPAGPAFKSIDTTEFSYDVVVSIWCPQWPKEARIWPHRRRKYGWPTTAIIHEIVQNGCHVVFAKHPACRNDVHQWRLSFSVAEVILLQSWTLVQQIVYHMLRFFAKRELIKKDCLKEDEVLCTYHFKTLMLWSCEEMSPEWWNSVSAIKICCNLLQKLANWLKRAICPNYFIPRANLFHEHFNRKNVDETVKRLIHFCESDVLSLWFVKHYMLQPVFLRVVNARCNDEALRCISEHMLRTCEAMEEAKPEFIDLYVSIRFGNDVKDAHRTAKKGFERQLPSGTKYLYRIKFLKANEVESFYWLYESLLRILHSVHLLDCKEMEYDSQWFFDTVRQVLTKPKFVRSRHHSFPTQWETVLNGSQLYFIKAQELMENLTGSENNDLDFKIVAQMSKDLFMKALKCEDSTTNAIASATLTYMAALNFAASKHETVIDLCSRLITNQIPEREEKETLNAGCLLYIDDVVRIIGFYILFRQIKDNFKHKRKRFLLDLRLTPEVFAHYLIISSNERKAKVFVLNYDLQTPAFLLDEMLMTITNHKFSAISKRTESVLCVYQRTDPTTKLEAPNEISLSNEEDIIQLFAEYSFENMTEFYNAICKTLTFTAVQLTVTVLRIYTSAANIRKFCTCVKKFSISLIYGAI